MANIRTAPKPPNSTAVKSPSDEFSLIGEGAFDLTAVGEAEVAVPAAADVDERSAPLDDRDVDPPSAPEEDRLGDLTAELEFLVALSCQRSRRPRSKGR